MPDTSQVSSDTISFLGSVPMFADFDDLDRAAVADACQPCSFEAGRTIVERGKRNRAMYIIVSGDVDVVRKDAALNRLGPGQVFGEISALGEIPATANVRATSSVCCLQISGDRLRTLVRHHAALGWAISFAAADRLRFATEREEARTEELKAALDELRRTQLRLVQSEKMASLGMFIAGLSHELNSPIGGVRSSQQTLTKAVSKLRAAAPSLPDDAKQRTLLDLIDRCTKAIEDGTERIETVLEQLRRFARLDESEHQRFDANACIEETARLLVPHLDGSTVVTDLGDLSPIRGNPRQLNQALFNIMLNAAEACAAPSTIQVRSWLDGEDIHISVSDPGVGIPPAAIAMIFDPGFTTRGVGVGTGLGLSIAHQIVQDHGGRIDVESVVDEGTTVDVVLPLGHHTTTPPGAF